MACEVFSDVAQGFFQWTVLGYVVAHVDKDEGFDVCGLCHFGGGDGSGLAVVETVGLHDCVVVAAHAEHHIGVLGEIDHRVAWFSVTGEDDGFARCGVDAVGEGVEIWLDVDAWCGGDFPFVGGANGAGSDVSGVDYGWFSGEGAASVYVDVLRDWEVDAGIPIVGEDTFLFV